jgi:hypothetical protein
VTPPGRGVVHEGLDDGAHGQALDELVAEWGEGRGPVDARLQGRSQCHDAVGSLAIKKERDLSILFIHSFIQSVSQSVRRGRSNQPESKIKEKETRTLYLFSHLFIYFNCFYFLSVCAFVCLFSQSVS